MKVVILAGGLGTRISEESHLKPKPMIEVGDKPILWHIMKIYSTFGYNDFIICLGYKAYLIKEFFADYFLHTSDVTIDLSNNKMTVHNHSAESWKVTLINTGLNTMTGGRIKRVQEYVGTETFMLTYGDGVADVNIKELVHFHQSHGKMATMTAINVGQKFGIVDINAHDQVSAFREKSDMDGDMINGGFLVLNPDIFNYIEGDTTVFEKEPLERIARENQLMAYRHNGFWKCMDTQRDRQQLEELWTSGQAPWRIW